MKAVRGRYKQTPTKVNYDKPGLRNKSATRKDIKSYKNKET